MIEQLFEFFSGAGKHWALFFVSVFPFIELRGAIPFGILALDMPWYQAFLLSFAANLLPIPVVYFLTRPLFAALRKTKLFSGFIDRFEAKMMKKSEKVTKYKIIGLFLFVAVPLPGTGAWSGALIAALLDMPLRRALAAIALGVLLAGTVMTLASTGVLITLTGG